MLAASFTMLRCTIPNTSLIFDSNTTQILNHSQIATVAICFCFDCDVTPNGVFGKLPSHQMAVAIMCLIGKEIREIHFGHRALPYILCAYKYIQCL